MMNLKIKWVILAGLLALMLMIVWPALPAQSNDISPINEAAGPDDPAQGNLSIVPAEILAITNGMLVDGTGADPIPDGVVVIQDQRILAAGPAGQVAVPAGAEIIDAAGGTIMPGIINAHAHNTQSPDTRYRFLTQGVMATCDLASSAADMAQFEQRYNVKNQAAARGFRTGPMITAPGGYPSSYGFRWDYQVATPTEAQAAVTDLISQGADMIKIALEPWQPQEPWPVLDVERVLAIVETAHRFGVPVRAHVQQAEMLDIALAAGVDAVEHVPLPFSEEIKLKEMARDETLSLADYPQLESQLGRMAGQGVTLVPALNVGTCATHHLPELETEAQRRLCNFQLEIVGRFHQMGGMVALGNDYGNLGVEAGMPLTEMKLLLEAGLSPLEVIRAGTQHAAQVCGHGGELGTLEPGKLADIIVVDGNPLVDLEALIQVNLVIQNGEFVYQVNQ
jgi:imidazolonepropionase-like amidohydrolase